MDNAVQPPPGRLLQLGSRTAHYRVWGELGANPPIVLECGLTMMSSCWAWLAPELARSTQVFACDRAGLGWSSEVEGLRTGDRIAMELREFLRALRLQNCIFIGHSIGALFLRSLYAHDPHFFAGMAFLDGSHPEQLERNRTLRRRTRNFFLFLEGANLLAQRGLPRLTMPFTDQVKLLPLPERNHLLACFRNSRHLRASVREARSWAATAASAARITALPLPLLIISAQRHAMPGWAELQKNFEKLSTSLRHVVHTDASHLSILTHQDHAQHAAVEIRTFFHL